jgi:hypothetical protein
MCDVRQEHRSKVFKNRVLTRMFEPKTDKVIGASYLLIFAKHNQNNEIKVDKMGMGYSTHEGKCNA